MADSIVLMEKGEIQQIGSPEEIYHEPGNLFAAQFIGTPPMNVRRMKNGCSLGFRPESVALSEQAAEGAPICRRGVIAMREMLGAETLYRVNVKGDTIMVRSASDDFRERQSVWASVAREHLHFFDADGKHVGHGGPDELVAAMEGMRDE